VEFAQGVFITQSEDRSSDEVLLADPARNRQLIAEAVALAQKSDIILLAIGDTEQTSREGLPKTIWATAPVSIWWASRMNSSPR
jgi:beta-glucosidase